MNHLEKSCESVDASVFNGDVLGPVGWRYAPSEVCGDQVLTQDPKTAQLAREHGRDVQPLYAVDVERMAGALFAHIKHGDEAHREWLRVQVLAWAHGYFGTKRILGAVMHTGD